MKTIVYTRQTGGIVIVHPVAGARLATAVRLADGTVFKTIRPQPVDRLFRRWPVAGAVATWAETEEEFVTRIRTKDVPPDATDVQVMDSTAIPSDREFRDAWIKPLSGPPVVDMTKARAIQQARIETVRKEAMRDVMLRDALGGDVTAEKAQLRAINPAALVAGKADVAALKAAWPAALAKQ